MKPQEIIQAAEMYTRIMEALKECEKVNKASKYNGDLLWVMCNGGTHYTNELFDIMPGAFADEEKFYRCKNLKETAAKFTALCLEAGRRLRRAVLYISVCSSLSGTITQTDGRTHG